MSNGSCNSDADEENVDTCEDMQMEDGDGEDSKIDDSAAAKRRGPRTTIKAKQVDRRIVLVIEILDEQIQVK